MRAWGHAVYVGTRADGGGRGGTRADGGERERDAAVGHEAEQRPGGLREREAEGDREREGEGVIVDGAPRAGRSVAAQGTGEGARACGRVGWQEGESEAESERERGAGGE